MYSILLPLLVAILPSKVMSQAPGDSDSFCTTPSVSVSPPSYSPNQRMLMDSYHYINLLGGGPWQQVDVDGVLDSNSGRTQWVQQSSQACLQRISSCHFTATPPVQNNWLIFQHIRRLVNRISLSQVTIQIDFEISDDCNVGCQNSFNLELWETSIVNNMESRNTLNYRRLRTITKSNSTNGINQRATIPVSFSTNESGFYLAIVDTGSCITVTRVLVFYYVCPSMVKDLIIHPEIIAPPILERSEIKFGLGQCINGTVGVPSPNITLSCSSTGVWRTFQDGAHCRCDPGFVPDDDKACRACPAGHYSSMYRHCLACPANSWNNESSATMCQCFNGYFRAPGETADYPCTKPPGKPTSVKVNFNNFTFILLEWAPPNDNGGRNDTTYTLWLQETGSTALHKLHSVVTTSGIVSDVPSNSSYSVFISAENGVSPLTNFSLTDLLLVITVDPLIPHVTSVSSSAFSYTSTRSSFASSFNIQGFSLMLFTILFQIICMLHLC